MASRNIQVNLQFNANVQGAKSQLQQLQTQLNTLINNSSASQFGLTPQIQEATRSAMDLKIALNNATNVNTGKLNLTKLQSELARSGQTIETLRASMVSLGPAGIKAFSSFASAVAQANTKVFSLQGGMRKLANTFMNTVRWQLTSQAIMAVTSAISDTVKYAKELDTSLNNIRIVTGKSADQMASFAKQANQAAKNLSTSTTKYTDASLIYYQQGLNDRAVKERTDVTVKLANVTSQSAETVSQWMTAIWNNFDDGSESLEYYADVLAKLGATTASSASEIAGGLEKFAAVADTIGLSYEYAASMLATITAETRQSEDVVGTALKTILSRMEQLKLGDTLDDGTTLGQYSLALQAIGVNIKHASGELKDMDAILQETGTRWDTLARDQQIALAQSVAGIRQYTQFMALMDNWDVMENNLETTEQANGALREQQRIYEESTRAAEERMKAAKEAVKATLFGGDDLRGLYNFGAGALEVINELLEAFGGLPTIMLAVAAALTKIYQPQVASFLSQTAIAAKDLGTTIRHPIKALKGENVSVNQGFKNDVANAALRANSQGAPQGVQSILQDEERMYGVLQANEGKMSASVKQRAQWEIEILQAKKDQVIQMAEEAELQQKIAEQATSRLAKNVGANSSRAIQKQANAEGAVRSHLGVASAMAQNAQQVEPVMNAEGKKQLGAAMSAELNKVKASAKDLGTDLNNIHFDKVTQAVQDFANNGTTSLEEVIKKIAEVQAQLDKGIGSKGVIKDAVDSKISKMKADSNAGRANVGAINALGKMQEPTQTGTPEQQTASSEKALGTIDKNLGKMNTSKLDKQTRARIASWKKESAEIKKLTKGSAEYNKRVAALTKNIKKHMNVGDKNNKSLRTTYTRNKNLIKTSKQLAAERKKLTSSAKKEHATMVDGAKAAETSGTAVRSLGQEYDNLGKKMANGGAGLTHWSSSLASGISGMATYAMSVSMLTSSFENFFSALGKGDLSIGDVVSSIASMAMGFSMLIPTIIQATTAIRNKTIATNNEKVAIKTAELAEKAKITTEEAGIIMDKLKQGESKENIAAAHGEAVADIAAGYAGVAKQAGQGPPGWVTAAVSAAMMLPVVAMVGASAIGGFSGGSKEAKQEEVSKGTESLEAINENQELASTVTDLTDEYNALRNAGESTADVLGEMKDKIPELIDSYKELAKTMGTHIDTSELEKAYEVFEKTGDTKLLEKAQEKIDKEVQEKERTTAKATMNTARELVTEAASSGIGDGYFDDQYGTDLGGISGEDEQIFKDALGDYYKESEEGIRFSLTDSGELIDVYDGMLKARSELEKKYSSEELEDLEYYNKLNEEIKEMAENMPDVINAQQALFDIEKEEALANERTFNKKVGLGSIGSVEEFIANKDRLIKQIQDETEWTEAQAEAYLAASDAYGGYAEAADFFSESGLGADLDATQEEVDKIKKWFAGLSEDDRTLAMSIDYTVIGSEEEARAALEEARKKAEEARILQEADALEVDAAVFNTYAEGLASVNKGLDKNSNLTKQIALNNLKISKGLETLVKSWDETYNIIQKGNKASFEYAEAIGEVKKAFEEMYGVQPSTEYIEKYSKEINDLVNGNLDSLKGLQDALAEDYILNIELKQAINDSWAGTTEDAQNQLRGLLDDIDTSIEIGKESTLSSDFLNSVQAMLDAGVIAEDQLETLFRAKGYELNITGWKKMPGPEKTLTRKVSRSDGTEYSETIKESEEINVPIINGQTGGLEVSGTASVATVTKSTDKRVINTSASEEKADKAQDRLNDLKDEKDRYHEINEIISDTERALSNLSKAKDRAFGENKLALMDQEIEKQKELIKNNETLLEEAKQYLQQDKQNLINNTKKGLSIEFDKYGRIANYEELQNDYIERLRQNVNNTAKYEEIEEEYEAFKDAAAKYEETLGKVEEQADAVNDQTDELYAKSLEKIEYKVQIKVDIADDDKAYIDFLMQKIEDDAFAAADAIGLLGKDAQVTLDKIAANQQGIADVEAAVASGEITPEQGMEKLREYRNELVDLNAELLEIRNTVQDKLTESFEAWNEKIEKGTSKIEFYGSVLSGFKNIIDLVGKDMLGLTDETIKSLNGAIVSNANDAIKATKSQLDANKATLERMKQAREEARARGDEEAVLDWDEQIEIAEEKVQELTTTLQENLSTGLEASISSFQDTVDQIVEGFSEAVSGIYDSIEEMREAWDRQGEIAERYLNTYQQTYEINKLNRQIQNSIDKTDNVGSQRELRELQQEMLEMTKDGQQLSKYDLEYLQKKYDLLVAEQALKDAQNAKSVVTLRRDSEGNYGYVYTADQNAIDNAMQNYEDKLYSYQNFSLEMDKAMTEAYIAANERYIENLAWVKENFTEGTEEYEEQMERVNREYAEDLAWISDESEKLTTRNIQINQNFSAGVADTYSKTYLGQILPNYQSFEQLYTENTGLCEQATGQLNQAIIDLRNKIDEQLELAGYDADDFEQDINEEFGDVQQDSSDTATEVEDMAKDMDTALNGPDGAISKVEDFQKAYYDEMEKVWDETDKIINKVNELIGKYGQLSEAAGKDYEPNEEDYSDTETGDNSTNDDTGPPPKQAPKDSNAPTDLTATHGWVHYNNANLYLPNQGHTVPGDRVMFNNKEDVVAQTELRDDGMWYLLTSHSGLEILSINLTKQTMKNYSEKAATVTRYDESGNNLGNITLSDTMYPILKYRNIDAKKGDLYRLEQGLNLGGSEQKPTYWLRRSDLIEIFGENFDKYDTGGYTGDWGPEGRLAMLHQKEIVLNAHDTENFLTAIGIVRDISDQLEKNALAMGYQNAFAHYAAGIQTSDNILQQEVHITAEFPNATDHNEIEEAFRNLTNLASQYANRKF